MMNINILLFLFKKINNFGEAQNFHQYLVPKKREKLKNVLIKK